jgi:hypothetical protein
MMSIGIVITVILDKKGRLFDNTTRPLRSPDIARILSANAIPDLVDPARESSCNHFADLVFRYNRSAFQTSLAADGDPEIVFDAILFRGCEMAIKEVSERPRVARS